MSEVAKKESLNQKLCNTFNIEIPVEWTIPKESGWCPDVPNIVQLELSKENNDDDNHDELEEFKKARESGTLKFKGVHNGNCCDPAFILTHETWDHEKTKRYFKWLKTTECKPFQSKNSVWM